MTISNNLSEDSSEGELDSHVPLDSQSLSLSILKSKEEDGSCPNSKLQHKYLYKYLFLPKIEIICVHKIQSPNCNIKCSKI